MIGSRIRAAPTFAEFLDGVLQNGGGAYFDIMSFHSYPPFAPNWATQGPGLYEKTLAIRQKLQEYGLQKPIFITEAGEYSDSSNPHPYPLTEERQARAVVQLYAQAAAADVRTLIWFMLYDPPAWYPDKNGLVTAEESPRKKLAFDAYTVAVRMMDGMRPVGSIDRRSNRQSQHASVSSSQRCRKAHSIYRLDEPV